MLRPITPAPIHPMRVLPGTSVSGVGGAVAVAVAVAVEEAEAADMLRWQWRRRSGSCWGREAAAAVVRLRVTSVLVAAAVWHARVAVLAGDARTASGRRRSSRDMDWTEAARVWVSERDRATEKAWASQMSMMQSA